jgi:TIGR03009 family protein
MTSLEGKRMNRTLGRISGPMAAAVIIHAGLALAQQAEQHWQATPNYPSNNGPNYQPPTAQAGQYPPQDPGAVQQQSPPPDSRYGGPSAQPQYGPQPPADNRQGYSQYPPGQPGPGQAGPLQGQPQPGQPMQGPPVRPPVPQAPFVLTPQQMADLDNLLVDWERRNRQIQVLESKFFRWKYDSVFASPANAPPPKPDEGELKFAAPDKAWMKIDAKDPKQSEQWLCDGKSVFQWNYSQNEVTEWMLPPEMQGKGIGEGPLPFVFGIEAQRLKQRYFMRLITPPNVQNEVWLEAYPKFQHDAANYHKVEVILQKVGSAQTLFPFAIQIYAPNGGDRTVYQLRDPEINPRKPFGIPRVFGGGDWTKPSIDRGWTKRTEAPPEGPANQTGANPAMQPRR